LTGVALNGVFSGVSSKKPEKPTASALLMVPNSVVDSKPVVARSNVPPIEKWFSWPKIAAV